MGHAAREGIKVMQDTFADIYQNNSWRNEESVSGHGSTMDATAAIRREIPKLVDRLNIQHILDIPCGDFHWFNQMPLDLVGVIGADVVPELIESNIRKYNNGFRSFRTLDITTDALPRVDLILCRDLLGHFSNRDVQRAIKNLRKSGSKYLLATTFPGRYSTSDITTGEWRPINLAYMFGLPDPMMLINEECVEGNGSFSDKSLGLWDLQEGYYA